MPAGRAAAGAGPPLVARVQGDRPPVAFRDGHLAGTERQCDDGFGSVRPAREQDGSGLLVALSTKVRFLEGGQRRHIAAKTKEFSVVVEQRSVPALVPQLVVEPRRLEGLLALRVRRPGRVEPERRELLRPSL